MPLSSIQSLRERARVDLNKAQQSILSNLRKSSGCIFIIITCMCWASGFTDKRCKITVTFFLYCKHTMTNYLCEEREGEKLACASNANIWPCCHGRPEGIVVSGEVDNRGNGQRQQVQGKWKMNINSRHQKKRKILTQRTPKMQHSYMNPIYRMTSVYDQLFDALHQAQPVCS